MSQTFGYDDDSPEMRKMKKKKSTSRRNGSKKRTPSAVSEFLREAGRKGGRKSQQHPRRKELNRKAIESRWRKEHPVPKNI